MSHHYAKYFSLREEIHKDVPFKVYFKCKKEFWPQDVDAASFESNKTSWEESCCSTSSREEEYNFSLDFVDSAFTDGCATLQLDQREITEDCSSLSETSIDGCPPLYGGDM